MSLDETHLLRIEIEELKLQRQDLRQLKTFQESEAEKWKEEARVAREEKDRVSVQAESLGHKLSHWEEAAKRSQEALRVAQSGKEEAESEATRLSRLLEEAEGARTAGIAITAKSNVVMERLVDIATARSAELKEAKEGLEKAKGELAACSRQCEDAVSARNLLEGRMNQMTMETATLRERLRATEAKVDAHRLENEQLQEKLRITEDTANKYHLKNDQLERQLEEALAKAHSDAEGGDGEAPWKRRRMNGSEVSVGGASIKQPLESPRFRRRVTKEESSDGSL